jgi:DNA repair exonuclease SbcCD nuclease subunit
MKIAILSDIHLGYGTGTEREDDPFDAMQEMMQKSLDADAIIIAGDLFDTRIPGTETFVRAMQLLARPMHAENGVRISGGIGKDAGKLPLIRSEGIPVVAIHGTHERRVKGLLNPVEALERAGFIIYLHCNGIVLEKGGERVCIQGMSGVPDQFAPGVLEQWDPKPQEGCSNIFMIHQSISPFMYAPHLLPVEKLPPGFDLYVCGHMHDPAMTAHGRGTLLIPVSPVTTQMTRESVRHGGLWTFDTTSGEADFLELESCRKAYYVEMDAGKATREGIEKEIRKLLEVPHNKKPLIRIKLSGNGESLPTDEIKTRFEDVAMVSFRKEAKEEEVAVKNIEEHRLSVQELGKKLLDGNLREYGLDARTFEQVFELLHENRIDRALELLRKV